MPFVPVPVPQINGKQRSSPGCLLAGGIICFLFLIPVGIGFLLSKPMCGGESMRAGDECVYRDAATNEVDHTEGYGEEQLKTRLGGLFALTLGSVILFFTVRQFRTHRQLRAHRAMVAGQGPPPLQNDYTQQIAWAAHAQHQAARTPPPPPPPPPPDPPSLHHDA